MSFFAYIFLALASIGSIYYVVSTLALVRHFFCTSIPGKAHEAKVSILKPISGIDPHLESGLRSYLAQDHPNYEVLFGTLSVNDPALRILQRLDHTHHIGSSINGPNNKARILHTLSRYANGDILVITDSDTCATPCFLSEITSHFADPSVGAVTCLYKAKGSMSPLHSLQALHMSCIFSPGVACHNLKGIDFGLGAAIAVRIAALEKTDGFERLAHYLADDFQLGRMISLAGFKVVLARYIIEISLGDETMADVMRRELRWSVTTRVSRPWGHFGLIFTFGFVWAAAFLLASGFSQEGWIVLAAVSLIRMITAWIGVRVCLKDSLSAHVLYLLPLRDFLSFAIWLTSYFTRNVTWRGRTLRIFPDGRMAVSRPEAEKRKRR